MIEEMILGKTRARGVVLLEKTTPLALFLS